LIREGNCRIFTGIDRIENETVYFRDGNKSDFDAIIAAVGYHKGFEDKVLHIDKSRYADLNVKAGKQKYFGKDGLYFCGFFISPTGQIREIALDAQKIAAAIIKNRS
jgi:hypothetical protein